MDLIYDAAAKFLVLEQFEYHFVVSQKRRLQTINHTMDEILIKHTITDPVIGRSVHYVSKDSKTDVRSRIEELTSRKRALDIAPYLLFMELLNQLSKWQ